jgi:DNA-binding MarR family transcriptional regulator
LFAEGCAAFGITPVQFSILTAAAEPGLEEARLACAVGVDRTTLANVMAPLEARGMVRRTASRDDQRVNGRG